MLDSKSVSALPFAYRARFDDRLTLHENAGERVSPLTFRANFNARLQPCAGPVPEPACRLSWWRREGRSRTRYHTANT